MAYHIYMSIEQINNRIEVGEEFWDELRHATEADVLDDFFQNPDLAMCHAVVARVVENDDVPVRTQRWQVKNLLRETFSVFDEVAYSLSHTTDDEYQEALDSSKRPTPYNLAGEVLREKYKSVLNAPDHGHVLVIDPGYLDWMKLLLTRNNLGDNVSERERLIDGFRALAGKLKLISEAGNSKAKAA